MQRTQRPNWTAFTVFLLASTLSAWAQQAQGSLTGTVSDASGAVVPGVTVSATEEGTGFRRSALTSVDGTYLVPLLPPGRYVVSAQKEGFEKYNQGPFVLAVDQHLKIDIPLKIGVQTTVVHVEASPPILDTETNSVGTTVEEAKVSQLPFNGRHFLEATLFTPGVVPGTQGSELNNSSRGGSINVNGLRETMNTFLLDGLSDTSIAVGTYVATPPLDSIQEFRMETGVYDAKFGTNAGAQINMVTKSGSNKLHGTLYEYLRNNKLDARNFFEPSVPPFHRNQYGASLGGPVVLRNLYDGHDKTFFFLNYEGLRDNHSFFSRAHVPTLAERTGDLSDLLSPSCSRKTLLLDPLILFSPKAPLTFGNNLNNLAPLLPSKTLDPVGSAFVSVYPQPNIPNAACGAQNLTSVVKRVIDINNYVGRFDHHWGTKDSLFYRFNLTADSELIPSGLPTGVRGYGTRRVNWYTQTGLDWVHTFSPKFLNEAKVGYNRWQYNWNNEDQGIRLAQQLGIKGVPTAQRDTGIPNLGFSGFDGLGGGTSTPQAGAVNTFQFADTVTQIHGSHSLAYGADIKPIKRGNFFEDIDARTKFGFNGLVTGGFILSQLPMSVRTLLLSQCPPASCSFGNGLADGFLGIPTSWIDGFSGYISGTATEFDYFVQDTWKVRSNLTLNLGLRYEFNNLVTDKQDRFGGFDFNHGLLMVAGRGQVTLEQFKGFISPASGIPVGQFVPTGLVADLGGTSQNRALQRPDRDNWAPRFGFAWQPFSNNKTVLRGGAGVYYDAMAGELYFQKSFNPPFFQLSAGNLQDNFNQVVGAIATGLLPLGTGAILQNVFNPASGAAGTLFPTLNPVTININDGKIFQWSLDAQRELPGSWLLDVGYVGTRGLHLPFMWDPNQGNPNPATQTAPRLYPNFLTMSYTDSIGKSVYHSLQVKAERHYSNGLAVIAGYTYAKSLDTNSTYSGTAPNPNFPENSYNLAAEKGRSDFDYRHRFSLAYVYDLPFGNTLARLSNPRANYVIQGWQLSGIAMLQSGMPVTPSWSGNPSHNLDGNDRPNVVPGASFYPTHQTVSQWFNPGAFSAPAPYTFGNAGRNILTGPGLADWDFSLIRKFKLTESKTLEFRAEMFNVLNQPNFTLPFRDASCSCFGVVGNTLQPIAGQASGGPGDPREVQFALRLTW